VIEQLRKDESSMPDQRRGGRRMLRISVCVLHSAFCIGALTGCGVVAVGVSKVIPQYVEAKYVPQRDKPMLVWAENYRNTTGGAVVDADQLGRFVFEDLEHHKVAPMIDPAHAVDLRAHHGDTFRQMPITLIGQEVGAGQVLYVSIVNADTEAAGVGDMMRGSATAMVRVVDVHSGATLWPDAASDGYPVSATTPVTHLGDGVDELAIRQDLQLQLARQISRLFYKYDPMAG
jgi:hypothetical protein